ncbi:MAG: phosphoglycerate dehydrogenase [Spirochaetales bacterium]|nr:phosphoglycerate dehydrogenase [Spirochaetales bacterium]
MSPKIKVTSPSFSANEELVQGLFRYFPDATINADRRRFAGAELIDFLADADGAIVGLEALDGSSIRSLPRLRVVSKYGVGLDNIDLEAARKNDLQVYSRPGVNRRSVSELALCYMLALQRNVFFTGHKLKGGIWDKSGGTLLSRKTVGLIGCGNIGEDLLRLLQPFHCKLMFSDLLRKDLLAQAYGATQVNTATILQEADVVSLHLPLEASTENIIGERALQMMQRHAFLINTSRGGLVDESALKAALIEGRIAGAALDVFRSEPPQDKELIELPNLLITPHIGGSAREAILAMGSEAIRGLVQYFLPAKAAEWQDPSEPHSLEMHAGFEAKSEKRRM